MEGSKTDYPFKNPGLAIQAELAVFDDAKSIACAGGFCNQDSQLNFSMLTNHATYPSEDQTMRSTQFRDTDFNILFPNDPLVGCPPSDCGTSPGITDDGFQIGSTLPEF